MQSNKIHKVFRWVSLFSTYVSSTCFWPHRSIIRSVLYRLYLQIWYVVIRVLLDTSSRYEVRKSWTCRVVRVLPHTKSANTPCKQMLLKMDRWGPKHVELTHVLNKLNHKKLCVSCWTAYCKMIHGPYSIKFRKMLCVAKSYITWIFKNWGEIARTGAI